MEIKTEIHRNSTGIKIVILKVDVQENDKRAKLGPNVASQLLDLALLATCICFHYRKLPNNLHDTGIVHQSKNNVCVMTFL